MHIVTISKTYPSQDLTKAHKPKGCVARCSHDSLKWTQMWNMQKKWACKNTEKCKYALYPHHKHSHADRHNTLPCAPPFSSACPHLPPAGSRVNVAGVAQSCLTDQTCDKQANWGGREDGLQRPAEYATRQVMLYMPLCLSVPLQPEMSECSRKYHAELFFFLRYCVRREGHTALGFVSCFG